jgi:DNA-binding FrmR family transcriptional regulator
MTPESHFHSSITRRLRCAVGDLQAVIEMTEAGAPCGQLLHQLNAVRAALHNAGIKIIECQAQSCQDVILSSTSVAQRIEELHQLQSLYAIFVQHFRTKDEVIYEQDSN